MGDETAWILEGIKALGVAGGPVFAVLYWLERAERREVHKMNQTLLEQMLSAINASVISVTKVSEGLSDVSGATKDITTSIGQLASLMRSLTAVIRKEGRV